MKLGLKNIEELLDFLGNPHTRLHAVHIAGTNGKGSTASMIAAVMTASGYKTGLYTSPHLVRFTERIRINGSEISEEDIVRYIRSMRQVIEKTNATFFEVTTAIAFHYFADNKVDIAVVETGLGGRLDATNVLRPLLTIITSVGLDHTEILGGTIEDIAREKAGIIKTDVPCLVGAVDSHVRQILESAARRRNSILYIVRDHTEIIERTYSVYGTTYDVSTSDLRCANLRCSLPGKFQKTNCALAIAAASFLRRMGFPMINESKIREGFARVQKYSGLRGRLEVISTSPFVIADVAHNPDAMKNLVDSLLRFNIHRVVAVFGIMADKDIVAVVGELRRLTRVCIAVIPHTKRAAEPKAIAQVFHAFGSRCIVGGRVARGTLMAYHEAYEGETILVTGSHYVVGEYLQNKSTLGAG